MKQLTPRIIDLIKPYQVTYNSAVNGLWSAIINYQQSIKPEGKLKRISFVGSPDKRYIDEKYNLFSYDISYGFLYCGSTFPL